MTKPLSERLAEADKVNGEHLVELSAKCTVKNLESGDERFRGLAFDLVLAWNAIEAYREKIAADAGRIQELEDEVEQREEDAGRLGNEAARLGSAYLELKASISDARLAYECAALTGLMTRPDEYTLDEAVARAKKAAAMMESDHEQA